MSKPIAPEMLDTKTPEDVAIRAETRSPETDPTLGIPVEVDRQGTPRHRLVTLGDSLTHGFQSGAVFNTSLSYPMLIAKEMGWDAQMRYPTYGGPGGGLPLNLEWLARQLEGKFGSNIDWWELMPGSFALRDAMDEVEDYWERGQGLQLPQQNGINHNLAIYGWDLRNTLSRTAEICQRAIAANPPKDDFLQQNVENANDRAALRVLHSARDATGKALTPLQAAAALGAEGTEETGQGDGIETLILLIGANNALGSILTFKVNWTAEGYDDMDYNDRYTVWRPIHFKAEFDLIVEQLKQIQARHVIVGTVPHVTIAPFARGVGSKVRPGSRYYPYYTVPWLSDRDFDPQKHPHLTEQEVRAIDSAIDQYNDCMTEVVRQARREGKDWYLFETVGLLDRLAAKRYIADPSARPNWWTQYELPPELQALDPIPDSRFFVCGPNGRTKGGLFSLDGIHPTTIGYGIMAQELIQVMELAGVKFYGSDGRERSSPIKVDFNRLIALDTLISQPPCLVANILSLIGTLDRNFNVMSSLMRSSF
jgi:hypothetical protein